ncbi:spore germination protein KB [Clostridia bacterium]|nr:spore germination protein KB [Clostridia bacterium]
MQKENITSRSVLLLIVITAGTGNMLLAFPMEVEQDTWISIILAFFWIIPITMIYTRLIKLMPGRDIYEMAEAVAGKAGAKIVSFLFGFYCLHLSALVLGNHSEFIRLTSLHLTPLIVTTLVLCSVCAYMAKSGAETLAKWCVFVCALLALTIIFASAYSRNVFDIENLTPVMNHSPGDILKVSFKLVSIPFGEVVIILALIGGLEKKSVTCKLFIVPMIIVTAFSLLLFVRSCGILGVPALKSAYFPDYKAVSLIKIGSFLERIEAILSSVYIIAGITKLTIALIGACRGAAKLFELPDYKTIVLPMCLLASAFSIILFRNILEMFDFLNVYSIYALLFQIIIPAALWIAAEIKAKRNTLPA